MRIHRYLTATHSEGPGNRFVIWTQGCPIHCPGCYSPELQDMDSGTIVDDTVLMQMLDTSIEKASSDDPLTGLTLLGGEPFFQAVSLAKIAAHAKEKGLNIITFTGYTYEFLLSPDAPEGADKLLQVSDVLIDGPFKKDQYSLARPMVGSSNQRFWFLTNKLTMQDFEPNRYEIKIEKDGVIRVNGMGDLNKLMEILSKG